MEIFLYYVLDLQQDLFLRLQNKLEVLSWVFRMADGKERIPFTMTTEKMKHGPNLNNQQSNTSLETSQWKDTTWSCIGNLKSINLSMFP